MGLAAPFADEVQQLIQQTHEQRVRLVANVAGPDDLTLDVLDYDLDFDETRSPRVQATFDVAPPTTQAQLDLLDPRTLVVLSFYAAYRLASGVFDEQLVARLYLRTRTLRREQDTTRLTLGATSMEALMIDGLAPNPTSDGTATFSASSLTAAVRQYVTDCFTGTPLAGTTTDGLDFTGPVSVPLAPHPWDALADICDQFDAVIYEQGDGVFKVRQRKVTVDSAAVLDLSIGSNGTLSSSESGVTRDDFANWVSVFYAWTNGAGARQSAGGYARVTSGPFDVSQAAYKYVTETREMYGTTAQANRAAAVILRRLLARSRSYTVEGVPAWWVRPEATVTLQLPLGSQERHLVSRVGFRPGVMTIETRLPDTASVIGE
jgi:hypothetical protein